MIYLFGYFSTSKHINLTEKFMRYHYPNASDALTAKKQFFKEHRYNAKHCFQNTWGTGYVIFDSKEDVNLWWKEHTGGYFYKEEYEPGTIFTESDAIKEIENWYGNLIDETLSTRDYTLPILAIGLPSPTAFGNRIFLKFSKSVEEEDIAWRFYVHYIPVCLHVLNTNNVPLRRILINTLYDHFYEDRFKKRIEGSKNRNK